ncbi:MAG TPA: DedA family protein [Acidimicrobiia bacterium]|nr:DedA family protein [Acidimicrobiia bacterium]
MFALNWLNPRDLIDTFGTAGLLLVVFIESGLVPAPLPGDSLLFIAGFFCSTKAGGNDPHLNLALVVLGAFAAALLGAQLGYLLGSRFGTRLFKPDARIFKTEYLERAQAFFDRSGPRAVVLARFIPFVRTIVPMLAGTSRMPQRSFVSANLTGAALWAVGVSVLGFFLGKQIGSDNIDKYLLPIVAVIIVLSLIPPFLEYRRHRRQRAAAAEAE